MKVKRYLDAKGEDGNDQLENQSQGQLPHSSVHLQIQKKKKKIKYYIHT